MHGERVKSTRLSESDVADIEAHKIHEPLL